MDIIEDLMAFSPVRVALARHRSEHGISRDLAGTLRLGSERGVEVLDVTISEHSAAETGADIVRGRKQGCFESAESIFLLSPKSIFILAERIWSDDELGEHCTWNRNEALPKLSHLVKGWSWPQSIAGRAIQTAVVAPAHVGKLQRAMKSDYSPQFPIRLMNKDFGLILDLAATVGARMPARCCL